MIPKWRISPTIIATTRSKTTVKTRVKNIIKISGITFVLTVFTIFLHSLILYATMNKIAAMVGIGISEASGIKNKRTKRSTNA